jgi:hypothetical protein
MESTMFRLALGCWLLVPLAVDFIDETPPRDSQRRTDVIVYGGTASGVIAAVAAAREGKAVLLIEPGAHLGGMVSGGLGATDTGNRAAIGGYAREFFNRVRDYYVVKYGPASQQVKDCSDGFHFEPHVAEIIFQNLIREAKVEVLYDRRHLLSVKKTGSRIDSISVQARADGATTTCVAPVFIDASYEGDLLAMARVKYTIGREGREQYGESLAGVQAHSRAHQWSVQVSPFGDDRRLLPFVQNDPLDRAGSGDRKLQAYNYRLCMTDRADNQVPFPKPPGYDSNRFELLARYLAKRPDLKVEQLMNPVRMPNGKTDTNNNGPFSTDFIGGNWDYVEADEAGRERIRREHINYTQGFLYFLANDSRVPENLHTEMNRWGLARDEFTDCGHWPHQLYVREARRMVGAFVMTQRAITEDRAKPDAVGLGSYNTDSHHVQRVVGPDGFVLNEGDFQVGVQPYSITYRSLTPNAEECTNLLVPVCFSASHVAYGTIRMEPVYMILGHACGIAAALAIDGETAVQQIPIGHLQKRLAAQKAVLAPEQVAASPSAKSRIDPKQLAGVVVDDREAEKTGAWVSSTAITPFVGNGYVHDNNQNKGQLRIRFVPDLPQAGRYAVRFFYTPNPNRATNVPVAVHSAEGDKPLAVNERQPIKDGQAIDLGDFAFEA